MLPEFRSFINEKCLISQEDSILLAVSGGIDSMVMAHLFLHTGNKKGIAHCNFSLRGEESDKDEELVRNFSDTNNIPFYSTKFETKEIAKKRGLSIQMAARELRYEWFETLRKEHNYDYIAVAHNLNDNIETLIINLTRGTGLAGLSGIRPVNNRIIRPILFAPRTSIEKYCKVNKIVYREDKSNADTKYTRNKIRHLVLPVLKEINPSIETTLGETAERLNELNEIISGYITKLRSRITEKRDEFTIFDAVSLKTRLHNKSVIFELFKPYGITGVQLDDLIKVIKGKTGGRIFTENFRIVKNRKEIIISPEKEKTTEKLIIKNKNDFRKVDFIESAEYIKITDDFEIFSDPSVACINLEKLKFPMVIRKWEAGDYFYPLGMKQKKKLSDYFIDKKVSIPEKENKMILESDGKIIWIIGDRLDNRFRITPSTKKALLLRIVSKPLIIRSL